MKETTTRLSSDGQGVLRGITVRLIFPAERIRAGVECGGVSSEGSGGVAGLAARRTRFITRKDKATDEVETEFLICSRSASELPTPAMFQADRSYWGIWLR